MPKKTTKRSTTAKSTAKKKTQTKGRKGGLSNVAAPAAGAVIGAALGGVAGAALTNNKTRRTLGDAVTNIGDYAQDAIKAAQENQDDLKKTVNEIASEALDKTKKRKSK